MQNLHKKIRILRQQKGFTLEAVSQAIGMTKGNLSRLERGEISITLERLHVFARFFGVSLEELYAIEVPEEDERTPSTREVSQKLIRVQQAAQDFLLTFLEFHLNQQANAGKTQEQALRIAYERLVDLPGIDHLFNSELITPDNQLYPNFKLVRDERQQKKRLEVIARHGKLGGL